MTVNLTKPTGTEFIVPVETTDTLRAMRGQADAVYEAWRTINPEWANGAHRSLSRQLQQLLSGGFGNTAVYRDGDLGLYVVSGITMGVVFFPTHHRVKTPGDDVIPFHVAPRMGMFCVTTLEPGTYCGQPITEDRSRGGLPTCAGHDVLAMAMPLPGEWSTHS